MSRCTETGWSFLSFREREAPATVPGPRQGYFLLTGVGVLRRRKFLSETKVWKGRKRSWECVPYFDSKNRNLTQLRNFLHASKKLLAGRLDVPWEIALLMLKWVVHAGAVGVSSGPASQSARKGYQAQGVWRLPNIYQFQATVMVPGLNIGPN